MTADNVAGQYTMGGGPNRVDLTIFQGGTFSMTSRSRIGDEAEVQGQWFLKGSELVLSKSKSSRAFRWVLQSFAHGDVLDLVPEETADTYRENPNNIGSRYRRLPGTALAGPMNAGTAGESVTNWSSTQQSSSKNGTKGGPKPAEVGRAKETRLVESKPATRTSPPAAAAERTAPEGGVTVFVFKPAPTERLNVSGLSGPGLARLSLNERGTVTAVKIIQSTGQRQFDADAADTLRLWRAKPGTARDVELPLTSVMSGKRIPNRVPTSAGSMASG